MSHDECASYPGEPPVDFRFQDEATDISVRAPVITLDSGARHLQGTYLERDMLASRLRVLARHS
ncbi:MULTISPECIES: hypothetical protein [unclassified Halomonas]|uniref:hypothetical protein n=1 Tax=unclassified Halomonas TaxID=2609666 RepID=UPI0040338928